MTASVAALSSSAFAGSYEIISADATRPTSFQTVAANCTPSQATAPAPNGGGMVPLAPVQDAHSDPTDKAMRQNSSFAYFKWVSTGWNDAPATNCTQWHYFAVTANLSATRSNINGSATATAESPLRLPNTPPLNFGYLASVSGSDPSKLEQKVTWNNIPGQDPTSFPQNAAGPIVKVTVFLNAKAHTEAEAYPGSTANSSSSISITTTDIKLLVN